MSSAIIPPKPILRPPPRSPSPRSCRLSTPRLPRPRRPHQPGRTRPAAHHLLAGARQWPMANRHLVRLPGAPARTLRRAPSWTLSPLSTSASACSSLPRKATSAASSPPPTRARDSRQPSPDVESWSRPQVAFPIARELRKAAAGCDGLDNRSNAGFPTIPPPDHSLSQRTAASTGHVRNPVARGPTAALQNVATPG